ncbi:triose-phosphate isomerase [Litorimonas sp. WD9-15]|uniref:triose-phosphate isomerase n=1 Tax=Litorimonas sp. WD9-15 TaxID=3418716 RepID=UPI003D07BF2B
MAKALRPLIAANWKMNGSPDWVDKPLEFDALFPQGQRKSLDVLICPPALYLQRLSDTTRQAGMYLGAQDCHKAASGAHTGCLSAEMLMSAGADYVIVGHSECRAAGDTNKSVKAKASAAKRAGLIPIICVGETEAQRDKGDALKVVKTQIKGSLPTLADYVIAYEPVWAIGTGKVPTLKDIAEIHDAIRAQVGDGVRILYGGSVKPTNAKDILAIENVNGALIGGAGLEMKSLSEIARLAV